MVRYTQQVVCRVLDHSVIETALISKLVIFILRLFMRYVRIRIIVEIALLYQIYRIRNTFIDTFVDVGVISFVLAYDRNEWVYQYITWPSQNYATNCLCPFPAVSCPDPPQEGATEKSKPSNGNQYMSQINYTCIGDNFFPDGEARVTIHCNGTGQWNSTIGKCSGNRVKSRHLSFTDLQQ